MKYQIFTYVAFDSFIRYTHFSQVCNSQMKSWDLNLNPDSAMYLLWMSWARTFNFSEFHFAPV